jgi:chromosome segregation ATPase
MRNSETCCCVWAVFAVIGLSLSPAAAQPDNAEARLRAQLRQATVQLRDFQDQNAQLMAKQAEAERDRMTLAVKLAADEKELALLRQQVQTSKNASDQATAQLQAQRENFAKIDAENQGKFSSLREAYNQAMETAKTREADIARFNAALVQIRGRIQACESKNTELVKLGKEVLDLYENRNVLSALASLEPITKLKRVEYQNLIQDYEDKMRANEIAHPAR